MLSGDNVEIVHSWQAVPVMSKKLSAIALDSIPGYGVADPLAHRDSHPAVVFASFGVQENEVPVLHLPGPPRQPGKLHPFTNSVALGKSEATEALLNMICRITLVCYEPFRPHNEKRIHRIRCILSQLPHDRIRHWRHGPLNRPGGLCRGLCGAR